MGTSMRTGAGIVFYLFIGLVFCRGQNPPTTKIYLRGQVSITTILNPNDPILVGNITLLETNLDSLGFQLLKDKVIYVPFEVGKTYYFHSEGGGNFVNSWLVGSSAQEFWLNVNTHLTGKYRHYFLDRTNGLKLLEERRY